MILYDRTANATQASLVLILDILTHCKEVIEVIWFFMQKYAIIMHMDINLDQSPSQS